MARGTFTPSNRSKFEFQLTLFPLMETNTGLIEQIRNEVKENFLNTKSHDQGHIERVYNLCMYIGRKEAADLEVVGLAALLHDIGRQYEKNSKSKVSHAKRGASLARKLLRKYHVDEVKIKKVIECIQTHRFRSTKKPKLKEAKILFDADKLDSIGAIGIGRAFLFAGEIDANLHNDEKVDIEKTRAYTKDDTAYREFVVKLRKIKARMYTEEGKRLAEGRHEFMEYFFDRFKKEIHGEL